MVGGWGFPAGHLDLLRRTGKSMRLPNRPLFFLILGPALASSVCAVAWGATAQRILYFVNAGTEPVYAIRIGHRAAGSWSEDLLAATQVIGVGDARRVSVDLHESCRYDVRLEYGDGHTDELDDVDLCAAPRVFLKH